MNIRAFQLAYNTFNRTRMELKLFSNQSERLLSLSFNRTRMELKPSLPNRMAACIFPLLIVPEWN